MNLLINSAIFAICYVQKGEQRKSLELEYGDSLEIVNELAPVLTNRGVSLKLMGKIYDSCVQRVLV